VNGVQLKNSYKENISFGGNGPPGVIQVKSVKKKKN
jgi:hypothetical protein